MSLFGIKDGLRIFTSSNNADVLTGTSDPSSTGVAAPEGSLYLRTDGVSYKKTGSADTDWQAYSEIEGGGLLWTTIASATTADVDTGYVLDASGGAFTVTLPAAPAEGDAIGFAGLGDLETNNVTVSLNGNNMNGASDDLVIDLNYCYFELLYTGDSATGWVLSNTDESGNVDNIQAFIGNNNNTDPAITEFTEENYITSGDSLEDAIDALDQQLFDVGTTASGDLSSLESRVTTNEGDISTNQTDISTNVTDISTNASGISALESYTGSAGADAPDYDNEYYITDGDTLEDAISKLDDALNSVNSVATTGVNWRQSIKAATGDIVDTAAGAYSGTDHFSDDDEPFWGYADWQDGDKVLSVNTTTSGFIYTWDSGGDQWQQTEALGANDAVAVRYDFLDNPGSQEDGAAYMMNAAQTEVIKIADFDLETAATIALSAGYTATSGTISSADSVETAIEKLDARADSASGDLSSLESRVTTNEYDIDTNASGIATNVTDIDNLESFTGSGGDANPTYVSTNYVSTGNDLETAIGTLDDQMFTNASGIAENSTHITNVDTAHDNLAAAVLTESTTSVAGSSTGTALDTVTQTGNLGAKWFVIAYDGAGNRYAAEIYAMHDGTTTADLTEYAILNIGTTLDVDFDVSANGTDMSLTVDNNGTGSVTVKTQRITVQTASVDTTADLS